MVVQYQAAFTAPAGAGTMDAPYWRYAAQSNACAAALASGLQDAGFELYLDVTGNQQFVWATHEQAARFAEACGAETMVAEDPTGADRVVVRFVTSWRLAWMTARNSSSSRARFRHLCNAAAPPTPCDAGGTSLANDWGRNP